MKATILALFVALLMVGCGEEAQKEAVQEEAKDDPSVPLAIPCIACGEKVSKKTERCLQCGHPTPDSVVAYKKAQELERIRAEEERRLAAIRAEKEAKAQAKHIGLDDYTIILNAVDEDDAGDNYTGWTRSTYDNEQISTLSQFKDGKQDGLQFYWYENGQKRHETNLKDGKHISFEVWKPNGEKCPVTKIDKDGNGVAVVYNDDGTEYGRGTFKDGELVRD